MSNNLTPLRPFVIAHFTDQLKRVHDAYQACLMQLDVIGTLVDTTNSRMNALQQKSRLAVDEKESRITALENKLLELCAMIGVPITTAMGESS